MRSLHEREALLARERITHMEYVKVVSSQIAEVGYGDGLYGPETLGLRFPPTKKQVAAGEPGSEYHYGNITPLIHGNLMEAPSIGSYFGKVIKPFPDKYPFTKVEADPTQPAAAERLTSGTSETFTKKNSTVPSTDKDGDATNGTTDTPSPVPDAPILCVALAMMNGMADDKLFAPGSVTDVQLETMRSDWLAEAKKYDISTEAKRTALKRFARPLQKLRTGIEERARELTGATKRKIAAIDTEKRRLVQVVGGIEDEVLAPLTAWEKEEEARKQELSKTVNDLSELGQVYRYSDAESVGDAIRQLESFDTSSMQEYKLSAESAIAASLKVLKPELERRIKAEADAKELEKLRAEAAARADEARIAAAAQALADKQTQERLDAAVEAAKATTRQEVIAEFAPLKEEAKELLANLQAPTMEEIADVHPFEYLEIAPRPTSGDDLAHKQAVHAEVVEALMGCALTRHEALAVLTAITEGRVRHLSIQY